MRRVNVVSLLSAALALTLLGSADASARIENLRWTHPDPDTLTGFRVYVGFSPRSYADQVDAGLPTYTSGVFSFDVEVDDTSDVYLAVTAIDQNDRESFLSNELCRGATGECAPASGSGGSGGSSGGGSPPPSGPQGEILGFALWDAQNDVRIDGDFVSGESIVLSDTPCASIEVRTNGYLASTGPGSVKFEFNGTNACDVPGLTYENTAPYAWEEDQGPGKFACADSLTVPGTHTLVVTPFDGDNCTGESGAARTITFEVVGDGGGNDPPPAALGAPGQPVVIVP